MLVWLIISAAIRSGLVAFIIITYTTFIVRIKGGFTETTPPFSYSKTLAVAVSALYIFHFILPT